MKIEQLEVQKIVPVNDVVDKEKYQQLLESMERGGWQGRPLVVVDRGDHYQALTGSHRLAAAVAASLEYVPAVVLDIEYICEDYDLTIDDIINDPDMFGSILYEYDREAAELLWEN